MTERRTVRWEWKPFALQMLEHECEDLEDFVHTIDAGLKSQVAKFNRRLAKKTKGMSEEQKTYFIEDYAEDAFGLLERYPRLQWQSVFISLYGFFDLQMNEFCRRLRKT